jgi:hypothetical protein
MRVVFRADTRGPTEIFGTGFQPRFPGGINITGGGQMTGGVSTSKDLGVSLRYAAAYGGWLYALWVTNEVDVLDYLSKKGYRDAFRNAMSQMEIAAQSIPGEHVIGARRARQQGDKAEMYGGVEVNAHCTVGQREKDLGLAYLNTDVTVGKAYAH